MKKTGGSLKNVLYRIYCFYRDGFNNMVLGRTLWKIIIIKLIIIFGLLKLFFFPNFLKTNFQTDKQRAEYVLEQITQSFLTK